MAAAPGHVKQIFLTAIEQYSPDQWPEYVEQVCGDDADLRQRVEILLHAHAADESLLDQPAVAPDVTVTAPVAEKPGDTIGPYTLREQIGEGGMGVVYRAKQTQPIKRSVALKVIKPGMDSQAVIARFHSERQALALMDHPHIAKVLDAGATDAGRPYFVLELVKGVPITDYCDGCAYSTRDRLGLFVQVCQAINHAHERGIIHRDVKPSNVLIEMRDGEPSPKVIDFGVAKAMGPRLTEHTLTTGFAQMLGTPLYMSPEQAEMSPVDVDVRSDVYSLGVLLYQLLTGTTPFDEDRLRTADFDELRRIIREEDPPKPSARLSTLGAQAETIAEHRRTQPHRLQRVLRGDLDWIVMKALEKDPRHRYVSANALAADVQRYLDDRPTLARPPSLTGRAVRWSRRHTALVMSTAVILLVSTVAFAVSTLLILSAYQRESKAHVDEGEARRGESIALAQATRNLKEAREQRDRADRRALDARRATYIVETRNAFRNFNDGRHLDAQSALETQIPPDGLEDLRGLEWYYLMAQMTPLFDEVGRHDGPVNDIDLFPDGRTIATAGDDGFVRIWDVDARSLVREFHLQEKSVYSVGVSPDGKWLAYGAGSRDDPELKPVTLIDARTGALLGTTNLHDTTIRQVRFSPDGRFLASASLQEKVSIWEFTNGVNGRSYDLTEPYNSAENFVVEFIDDNQLLTEFHDRQGYRLWNVETGEAVRDYPDLSEADQSTTNVHSATWCEELSMIAFVPNFDHIRLLDLGTGLRHHKYRVSETITCLAFSPNGNRLCAGTEAGRISVRLLAKDESGRPELGGSSTKQFHHGPVTRLRFVDESRVISGGADGRIMVVEMVRKPSRSSPFVRNERGIATLMAASPEGDLMAWSGTDGVVRLADRVTGRILAESKRPFDAAPIELTWSGDGSHLAAICDAGEFCCWRVQGPALVECLRGSLEEPSGGLALSLDGSRLYVGDNCGPKPDGIHVWDVDASVVVESVPTLYGPTRILVSPDDRLLIAASEGVFVFDRQTHSQRHHLQLGGVCTSLLWSPDGKTLVAVYRDGAIRLWDPDQGRQLRVLGRADNRNLTASMSALTFSHDGRTLLAGDKRGRLHFWNTVTWAHLGSVLTFPANNQWGVFSLAVTPASDALDLTVGTDAADNRKLLRLALKPE